MVVLSNFNSNSIKKDDSKQFHDKHICIVIFITLINLNNLFRNIMHCSKREDQALEAYGNNWFHQHCRRLAIYIIQTNGLEDCLF